MMYAQLVEVRWEDGTVEQVTLDQRDVFAASKLGYPPPTDGNLAAGVGYLRTAASAHLHRARGVNPGDFDTKVIEVAPILADDGPVEVPVDPTPPGTSAG